MKRRDLLAHLQQRRSSELAGRRKTGSGST